MNELIKEVHQVGVEKFGVKRLSCFEDVLTSHIYGHLAPTNELVREVHQMDVWHKFVVKR